MVCCVLEGDWGMLLLKRNTGTRWYCRRNVFCRSDYRALSFALWTFWLRVCTPFDQKVFFCIIKGRVAVRRAEGLSFLRRRRQAPVGAQKVAYLPANRVSPDKPPFTFVRLDCFGLFSVKRARSQVKRYAVLLTCLVTRVTHSEVAQSMDTGSFVNSMRRFIARRGIPKIMRSDNGTNFVSGNKEPHEALSERNKKRIHELMLQKKHQVVVQSTTRIPFLRCLGSLYPNHEKNPSRNCEGVAAGWWRINYPHERGRGHC